MPPPRKTRITDFARAFLMRDGAVLSNASALPSDSPNGATAPTRMKSRRDQPLQNWLFFALKEISSIVFASAANLTGTHRSHSTVFLHGRTSASSLNAQMFIDWPDTFR